MRPTEPDFTRVEWLGSALRVGGSHGTFQQSSAHHLHSGFVGRLALEIVNLSNDRRPITIRTGDPFMHMEFLTRDGAPDPYIGPYQFQFMSDEETSIYLQIMTMEFRLVFPEDMIKKFILNRIS